MNDKLGISAETASQYVTRKNKRLKSNTLYDWMSNIKQMIYSHLLTSTSIVD